MEELAEIAIEIGVDSTFQRESDFFQNQVTHLVRSARPNASDLTDHSRTCEPIDGLSTVDCPHNTWLARGSVSTTDTGPLNRYTVGVKDNIAIAGCPMTCGSSLLADFVPSETAPSIKALLEAGATISGKLNMDSFAWAGTGEFSDFGIPENPAAPERVPGGSSSGCASAVCRGDCDIAIGTDQGGSVRLPAAWCGLIGFKPSFNRIPFDGAVPIAMTNDHIGIIAIDIPAIQRAFKTMTGNSTEHSADSNQTATHSSESSSIDLDTVSIGRVKEAFNRPESDSAVDEAVNNQLNRYETAGCSIDSISLPFLDQAMELVSGIELFAGGRFLADRGIAVYRGSQWLEFHEVLANRLPDRADELPAPLIQSLMGYHWINRHVGAKWYGRCMRVLKNIRETLKTVFREYDAIVMPTTPMLPYKREAGRKERIRRAFANHVHTAPFNHSHNPAISLPCEEPGKPPIGVQLVTQQGDDIRLLRIASALSDI